MGFFTRDLGIDLGTANTLVYLRGKGIIIREPSVVAVKISGSRKEVLAVGERAKNMIGRTPGNIIAVKPLRDGVIADFDVTAAMLSDIIHRAMPRAFSLTRTRVVICVPCGVTGVERKAVEDAAKNAGASHIEIMEEVKQHFATKLTSSATMYSTELCKAIQELLPKAIQYGTVEELIDPAGKWNKGVMFEKMVDGDQCGQAHQRQTGEFIPGQAEKQEGSHQREDGTEEPFGVDSFHKCSFLMLPIDRVCFNAKDMLPC